MNSTRTLRPLPYPTPLTEPFWEACGRRELTVQHCQTCQALQFYPRATCTSCGSVELDWRPVSGQGTLYTFTIARRATHPRLTEYLPYVIAIVELDEGPRMTSTVLDCDLATLRIGQRLTVDFEDLGDVTVPVFRVLA